MYSLQEIAFNYYKINIINKNIILKDFQIEDQIMLFIKILKNVEFKKSCFINLRILLK